MHNGPYYFGCWDRPGHFLHDTHGQHVNGDKVGFPEWSLDGRFAPHDTESEGHAKLLNLLGWTFLAFWDRSVDSRGACNSLFLLPGMLDFDKAVETARAAFPRVWKRFKFNVRRHH